MRFYTNIISVINTECKIVKMWIIALKLNGISISFEMQNEVRSMQKQPSRKKMVQLQKPR